MRMNTMLKYASKTKLQELWPFPEYEGWESIFHHPDWHPEGDHSLKAHITTSMSEARHYLTTRPIIPLAIRPNQNRGNYWYLLMDVVLFHDIGKAATVKLNDKGHNSFIMHEKVGAEIFRDNYAHLYSDDDAEVIEFCIREHTNWWNVKKQGKSAALADHRGFDLLCYLCWCDKIALPNKKDEWHERRAHFRTAHAAHYGEDE